MDGCDPINQENYNLDKGYGSAKNKERDFLELCASPYEYAYDNPVEFIDSTGEQPNKNKKGFLLLPPIPPPPTKIGVRAANELSKKLIETAEKHAIKKVEKDVASKVLGRLLKIGGTTLGTALLVLTPASTIPGAGELPDYMKPKQYTPDESGAPFISKEEKDKYLEAHRITTDISTLTEQDKKAMMDRVNNGKATVQDNIYIFKISFTLADKKNNVWELLSEALKLQGFQPGDTVPHLFRQKWTDAETGIKYEVRIHPTEPTYGTGDIFRVSRQRPGVDANGQGQGTEYLDLNGAWHRESTLRRLNKDGTANPTYNADAARDTHISKPNIF